MIPDSMIDGFKLHPGFFDRRDQERLADQVRACLAAAPLYIPRMPRSGNPFSVRMSNAGRLGWVSDRTGGYRYQNHHPQTGAPWPPIPPLALAAWNALSGYSVPPEACLINWYDPETRMGLHRDMDEDDRAAPVLSISLGDTAVFRIGGPARGDATRSVRLASGDVAVLSGAARESRHGVDRILPGTSTLLGVPGRVNLTLRRVTLP